MKQKKYLVALTVLVAVFVFAGVVSAKAGIDKNDTRKELSLTRKKKRIKRFLLVARL